mmetsp:Transcript_13930/g.22419  ORF Transcript_13930/g.22419 Transcript_13930/m.22419 type:complete len:300 (-) Transcript_13930:308-1207(-)
MLRCGTGWALLAKRIFAIAVTSQGRQGSSPPHTLFVAIAAAVLPVIIGLKGILLLQNLNGFQIGGSSQSCGMVSPQSSQVTFVCRTQSTRSFRNLGNAQETGGLLDEEISPAQSVPVSDQHGKQVERFLIRLGGRFEVLVLAGSIGGFLQGQNLFQVLDGGRRGRSRWRSIFFRLLLCQVYLFPAGMDIVHQRLDNGVFKGDFRHSHGSMEGFHCLLVLLGHASCASESPVCLNGVLMILSQQRFLHVHGLQKQSDGIDKVLICVFRLALQIQITAFFKFLTRKRLAWHKPASKSSAGQ